MVAGMTGQPATNQGCLVGRIVVQHKMNIQICRDSSIDFVEEFSELDGAMASVTCAQNLARLDVESGKQGSRAVARVIVRATFHLARTHGQQRLHAVKSLDLGLFIHAQAQSPVGRAHVQSYDISDLIDEERVSREFESLGAMRLKSKCPPDTTNCALAQANSPRQRPSTPVSGVGRHSLQGHSHGSFHISIGDLSRSAWTWLVKQAVQTLLEKTAAPLPDRLGAESRLGRNHSVTPSSSATDYHSAPLCQCLAGFCSSNPVLQRFALLYRQREWRNRSSSTHRSSCRAFPQYTGRVDLCKVFITHDISEMLICLVQSVRRILGRRREPQPFDRSPP